MTAAQTGRDSQEEGTATGRQVVRRARGWRSPWTTVLPWTTPTAEDVAAMPVGSRRAVALAPGYCATVVKTGPDAWTLVRRYDLPDDLLTRVPSAFRVRKEDTAPKATVGELASFADAATRMSKARQ